MKKIENTTNRINMKCVMNKYLFWLIIVNSIILAQYIILEGEFNRFISLADLIVCVFILPSVMTSLSCSSQGDYISILVLLGCVYLISPIYSPIKKYISFLLMDRWMLSAGAYISILAFLFIISFKNLSKKSKYGFLIKTGGNNMSKYDEFDLDLKQDLLSDVASESIAERAGKRQLCLTRLELLQSVI